jgi:hypothetical protein
MKKKLEADLISIAHRILQLKNKSDINQLYLETQKLYEKLSVLRFVDEHFGDAKPTIGTVDMEQKIEAFFDEKESFTNEIPPVIEAIKVDEESTETPLAPTLEINSAFQSETNAIIEEVILVETIEAPLEIEEEIILTEEITVEKEIETQEEEIEEEESEIIPVILDFESTEEIEIEAPKQTEAVQISFEDLLGNDFGETLFVKLQDFEQEPVSEPVIEAVNPEEKIADSIPEKTIESVESKATSLNEKLAKGINIDLNDRIAFTKHLFGNNSEDYNRVLSQLITFNSFYEMRDFILEMVKPDYNNWEGKEEYAERFIGIIEKKFL